ncbi:MAG: SRPBCC domain-containing protein [Bacteroidota bacterium]|nr:SRPBCC domain-containing protein [Bacteroidota bacterium]
MLKKILLGLVAIIAVVLILAAFQPSTYRVERTATVAFPPGLVFAHLNDFHHWQKFNPFTDPDPKVKLAYEGAPAGEGAIYKWDGNSEVGKGEMKITESNPNEHIAIDMHFMEPFDGRSTTHFDLAPAENGTQITWAMEGHNNYFSKIMCLFMDMDDMVGKQFEKGLARMNDFTPTDQLAMNNNTDIVITREYNAPREAIWNAWTKPAEMMKWHGPHGYTCPVAKIDLREGGTYHTAMRATNGDTHWSTGTYKEIVPMERLVCTDHFADADGNIINGQSIGMPGNWPDEMVVSVTFEEIANGTRMTMTHQGIPAAMKQMCTAGWNESFDKLATAVGDQQTQKVAGL